MADSNVQEYTEQCEKHGVYVSEMIVMPDGIPNFRKGCPKCGEARRLQREAEEAAAAESKRIQDEMRDTERRRKAGVPARFDDKTLDSFRVSHDGQRKALEACRQLVHAVKARELAPNLILTGKPGTGKTHLSCGIVLELYKAVGVKRIDLPDLIREIRATWSRNAETTEDEVLNRYGSIRLLILEEVGTGSGSDDERARVFQVINRRYEAMLPTVIVTNLTLRELRDEMGERVIDRLREGERAVIAFDWESMRGEA